MLIGGQEIIGDGWGAFLFCMTNGAAILVQERQPGTPQIFKGM